MSEEIIIDGVNVAECEYFQKDGGENTCRAEEDYTGTVVCCSACDNCYFKQLQRLKQENEELKEDLKVYHRPDIIKVLIDYRTGELGLLQEKYNTLTNKFFNSEANNYKYKQALEEIREILCQDKTFYEGYFDVEPLTRVDTVIKKINEVLND